MYFVLKILKMLFTCSIPTIRVNENHKMATFDIKDLYVNIPIDETLKITEQQLMKNNDKQKTKQIIAILHTILTL